MPVSVEMYIVISLMFAVFAAVSAIGTSIVLGVGFERLRAGFDIVKKQTGFFADAIHQLDERTKNFEKKHKAMELVVADMSDKVERVDKQTGFFANAIHSIEERILEGTPVQKPVAAVTIEEPIQEVKKVTKKKTVKKLKKNNQPVLTDNMDWSMTFEAARLLKEKKAAKEQDSEMSEKVSISKNISSVFLNYLYDDNGSEYRKGVVYH